jgi:Fe-S cluster biogenesis protein NfuA
VAEDKEFRQRMQRIGDLVQKIEDGADPAVRATAKELVQLLMEMHGTGLEKILEITFEAGKPGAGIIDKLGGDPLVSSLLILYGLHPETLGRRVAQALDRIRPGLRKHGSEIELLAVDEGVVRVRIDIDGGHACGSTVQTIRSTVEDAIYESAPDITSLFIEGPEAKSSSGFVALEKLLGDRLSMPVVRRPTLAPRIEGAD